MTSIPRDTSPLSQSSRRQIKGTCFLWNKKFDGQGNCKGPQGKGRLNGTHDFVSRMLFSFIAFWFL